MSRYGLFIFFLFLFQTLLCQVPYVFSLGGTAGMERVQINPAFGIDHQYSWEATIVGGHIFGFSDYAYLRKASLLNFPNRISGATVIDSQFEIPETSQNPLLIFDENGGTKQSFLRGSIIGPAFSFSFDEGTRVGLFTNFKVHVASTNIPENFGVYELNNSYNTELIGLNKGQISGASWLEIGAHFSKRIENLQFGFNLKMLRAHEGFYGTTNIDADYAFVDSTIIVNGNVDLEIGFTNRSLNATSLQMDFNGNGVGIDLGLVMELYNMKFGLSIVDLGILTYNKNVEVYKPEILGDITSIRTQDYRGISDLRTLIDQFQRDQNITPDTFGDFSIGLPTRIIATAEVQLNEDTYMAGMISQRLPIFSNSLKSNNLLVISARRDFGKVSLHVPITLYEFQSIRLGTALNLGPLTVGTDHLTSFLVPGDFRGSDFYFALRVYPFGGEKNTSNRSVLCPM